MYIARFVTNMDPQICKRCFMSKCVFFVDTMDESAESIVEAETVLGCCGVSLLGFIILEWHLRLELILLSPTFRFKKRYISSKSESK